jgi:hypothetical protein
MQALAVIMRRILAEDIPSSPVADLFDLGGEYGR